MQMTLKKTKYLFDGKLIDQVKILKKTWLISFERNTFLNQNRTLNKSY